MPPSPPDAASAAPFAPCALATHLCVTRPHNAVFVAEHQIGGVSALADHLHVVSLREVVGGHLAMSL